MTGQRLAAAVVAVVLAGLTGCSGTTGRIDSDPANYAKGTKKRVKEFLAEARQNPRGLSQNAAVLVETLEAHTSAPVGEYKSQHEQLTEKCKALAEAAKRSPTSAETKNLLKEMDDLANQLPG